MFDWVTRLYLRMRLAYLDGVIEAEKSEQEVLLSLRWIALEEQDAVGYVAYHNLHIASARAMRLQQKQRDEVALQLQRISK